MRRNIKQTVAENWAKIRNQGAAPTESKSVKTLQVRKAPYLAESSLVFHLACWTRVACVANFILAQRNALSFLPKFVFTIFLH